MFSACSPVDRWVCALSCIVHVIVIWGEYRDTGIWPSGNPLLHNFFWKRAEIISDISNIPNDSDDCDDDKGEWWERWCWSGQGACHAEEAGDASKMKFWWRHEPGTRRQFIQLSKRTCYAHCWSGAYSTKCFFQTVLFDLLFDKNIWVHQFWGFGNWSKSKEEKKHFRL